MTHSKLLTKNWWDTDSMTEMIDWEDANWLPIEGYEERYFVSDTGLVMNNKGQILKQLIRYDKKRIVKLISDEGTSRTRLVEKLVAKYFVPNPKLCKHVAHIDGDVTNNRAINLKWIDYQKRDNPFKLDNKFYTHLHNIEAKYGSIAKAPYNDKDYITIQHIVGNC